MNICDVYKVQILILTFLIIGSVILLVAAWVKNRDADRDNDWPGIARKSIIIDVSTMSDAELESRIKAIIKSKYRSFYIIGGK